MLKTTKIILLTGLICFLSCKEQKNITSLEILPIDFLDYTSTFNNNGTLIYHKVDYFIVKNYIESLSSEKIIDDFVCNTLDLETNTLDSYHLTFFNESEKTNLKKIAKDDSIIDKYSHLNDHLFTYIWTNIRKNKPSKFKNLNKEKMQEITCRHLKIGN